MKYGLPPVPDVIARRNGTGMTSSRARRSSSSESASPSSRGCSSIHVVGPSAAGHIPAGSTRRRHRSRGRDHQHGDVLQLADEVVEHVERRLVGPVDVLEEHHQRTAARLGGEGPEQGGGRPQGPPPDPIRVDAAQVDVLVVGQVEADQVGEQVGCAAARATSGSTAAMNAAPASPAATPSGAGKRSSRRLRTIP